LILAGDRYEDGYRRRAALPWVHEQFWLTISGSWM